MARYPIIGGSLESPQWLIGCFCPKILGPWWGPTKAFCGSVNVHWVVVLFSGGGDTSPLQVVIEVFFATGGGDPKTQYNFISLVSPLSRYLSRPCLIPCLAPVSLLVSPLVCLTPVSPLVCLAPVLLPVSHWVVVRFAVGGDLTLQHFGGDTKPQIGGKTGSETGGETEHRSIVQNPVSPLSGSLSGSLSRPSLALCLTPCLSRPCLAPCLSRPSRSLSHIGWWFGLQLVGTLHCSILVGTLKPRQGARQGVRQGARQNRSIVQNPVSPLSRSLSRSLSCPLFVSALSRPSLSLSRPLFVSPLSRSLSHSLSHPLFVSPLSCPYLAPCLTLGGGSVCRWWGPYIVAFWQGHLKPRQGARQGVRQGARQNTDPLYKTCLPPCLGPCLAPCLAPCLTPCLAPCLTPCLTPCLAPCLTLGGGSVCRWWGHLTTIGGN